MKDQCRGDYETPRIILGAIGMNIAKLGNPCSSCGHVHFTETQK